MHFVFGEALESIGDFDCEFLLFWFEEFLSEVEGNLLLDMIPCVLNKKLFKSTLGIDLPNGPARM
jgi:hypothetical protein